jgi:ACS family glucarate transporter-like MFS transporter
MNISVASKLMMSELQFSKIEMGEIFSAFMLGYAVFQIPWGIMGDRFGPRRVLTLAAILWGVTTLLTGVGPGLWVPAGIASFSWLLVVRFFLGVGEAAAFPLAARAIANWIPSSSRAGAFSVVIFGTAAGSAITAPFISWLMVRTGWRASFYVCSALGFVLAILWNHSSKIAARTEKSMLKEQKPAAAVTKIAVDHGSVANSHWWKLLRDRNLGLICLSYFLDSYTMFMFVFWFYLYLVEKRGFSILQSGLYTSLPFIVAMLFVPLSGHLCDTLSGKLGRDVGRRIIGAGGLTLAAVFLLVGIRLNSPLHAIVGLSLSVGFLLSTEPAFWSASMDLSHPNVGAAGGIMNTAGNLGGVCSTALVPVLIKHFGWTIAFGSASAFALCGAIIWLFIGCGSVVVDPPSFG